MYTHSAKRLLGRMRWLARRRAFLVDKMSGRSRHYVDGYGHYQTQVRDVDEQLQQAIAAIERLATIADAKDLVRARESLQPLLEEAGQIVAQAASQPAGRGMAS